MDFLSIVVVFLVLFEKYNWNETSALKKSVRCDSNRDRFILVFALAKLLTPAVGGLYGLMMATVSLTLFVAFSWMGMVKTIS